MSVKSVQANLFLGPDTRSWSWRYPPKDDLMLVLGFAAIAAVSFAAGWFVGTVLTEHVRVI